MRQLSHQARQALAVLADGGEFALRMVGSRGYEHLEYRLRRINGAWLSGIRVATLYELKDAGMVVRNRTTGTWILDPAKTYLANPQTSPE